MIQEIIELWNKNKNNLENYFKSVKQASDLEYTDIVKAIFTHVINDEESNHKYDIEEMTVIDNGDYQGTLIYIIPKDTYQPRVDDYLVTNNYYGSWSGGDTLQSIINYSTELLTEEQIEDLMTVALHLVQRLKILDNDGEMIIVRNGKSGL